MSDSIIAVVPVSSDVDAVQECLSSDGLNVKFINSLEEALRLLSGGSTPVFFCDDKNRKAWRDPIMQMLESRTASRVVLLSTIQEDESPVPPIPTPSTAAQLAT